MELYRSFDGKLDAGQRNGYIVTECSTGNIKIESLHVMSGKRDSSWIIKPTDQYNRDTAWDDDTCQTLIEDIYTGNVTALFDSNEARLGEDK